MAAIFVDGCSGVLFCEWVTLGIADKNLGQRADLRGLAVEARGLDPGVFLVAVPAGEVGIGFALPRMERLIAAIVGVGDIFGDTCGNSGSEAVWKRRTPARLPSLNIAARKIEAESLGVEREIRDGEIISRRCRS